METENGQEVIQNILKMIFSELMLEFQGVPIYPQLIGSTFNYQMETDKCLDRKCGLCRNCGKLLRNLSTCFHQQQFQQFSTTFLAPAFQTNVAKEWASTIEDLSMKGWFKNERQQVLTWNPTLRFLCSWHLWGFIPDSWPIQGVIFVTSILGDRVPGHVEVIWEWSPLQLQTLPCEFLGDVLG